MDYSTFVSAHIPVKYFMSSVFSTTLHTGIQINVSWGILPESAQHSLQPWVLQKRAADTYTKHRTE